MSNQDTAGGNVVLPNDESTSTGSPLDLSPVPIERKVIEIDPPEDPLAKPIASQLHVNEKHVEVLLDWWLVI